MMVDAARVAANGSDPNLEGPPSGKSLHGEALLIIYLVGPIVTTLNFDVDDSTSKKHGAIVSFFPGQLIPCL